MCVGLWLWTLLPVTGTTSAAIAAPAWNATGSLAAGRRGHTATVLQDGRVLVAGGVDATSTTLASTELYDPATGTWTAAGGLIVGRHDHTATTLPDGRILVAGGINSGTAPVADAEVFDPSTGTWSSTSALGTARSSHTATSLQDGTVLVVGGLGTGSLVLADSEVYDPGAGTWSPTASTPGMARYLHTATLLPDGKVLAAGGLGTGFVILGSAELYDPVAGTWVTTGPMGMTRYLHTATLLPGGDVLVTGGVGTGFAVLADAERYTPGAGAWSPTGSMTAARLWHRATLLPSGEVLVAGGIGSGLLATAERYDPVAGSWAGTAPITAARYLHTLTLLPSGRVLVVGGWAALAAAEIYDAAQGAWTATGGLGTARATHTATSLTNGTVLVVGGLDSGSSALALAEIYNPTPGTWTATGALGAARADHTATLLPDGTVLVAGGVDGAVALGSVELYNPGTGSWTATGGLATARFGHTATLLPGGSVLVAGGTSGSGALATAELYNPSNGVWTPTGTLGGARFDHTATLLPGGDVLVAGGSPGTGVLASAERFDPVTEVWMSTGSLGTARTLHTATLLPSGLVLAAAGWSGAVPLSGTERFDPATDTWTTVGALATARSGHTATLLPAGDVLVNGGLGAGSAAVASTERFDPDTGGWTQMGALVDARYAHDAALLPDGQVLVAGGIGAGANAIAAAERYDGGQGFDPTWRPTISAATSPLLLGTALVVAGSGFRGRSEGGGGDTQASHSNYPLVRLQSLVDDQMRFLLPAATGWTDTAFTSAAVAGVPPGPARATVFVNGIPSLARPIAITADTTTTLIAGTPDPSTVGQPVTVGYDVTWIGGRPSGAVTVGDGTDSCTGSVAAGSCAITFTTVGTKTLTASFAGTAGFNPSASAAVDHTVIPSVTLTAITTHTPEPSVPGQAIVVGYGVTSSGGFPTGTVTVTSDGPEGCTGTVAAGQCALTFTAAGTRTLTATYAGNANFTASVSPGVSHSVALLSTTTTITADTPDPSTAGQPVSIAYTVTSVSGSPTGTVTVGDGVDTCTGTVAAGGCTLTLTTPGSRMLTATYAGDAAFAASLSAAVPHQVDACSTIAVARTSLPAGVVGTSYPTTTFTATGGQGALTYGLSGALPAGMSFAGDTLSGTPSETGSFPITVTATDTGGCTAARAYTLVINAQSLTYTLAEGATGDFFDAYVLVANPNAVVAPITVTFMGEDGTTTRVDTSVAPNSRYTLPFESVPALVAAGPAALTTTVASTSGVPLVVEGSTYWDATQFGGATTVAASAPSTRWYFAEGSEAIRDIGGGPESFFDTYLLIGNTGAAATTVTVEFLTEMGMIVTRDYTVGAASRLTIFTGVIPELANHSFGMIVTATTPITAARTQYFSPTYAGGHAATGVTAPSTSWLFADGASGPFFDTYMLLANPNPGAATVTITYTLASGQAVTRVWTVPAETRLTLRVDGEDPALDNDTFWMRLSSDQPIAAERAMYWRAPYTSWNGAHASPGVPRRKRAGASPKACWGERWGSRATWCSRILVRRPPICRSRSSVTTAPRSCGPRP